MSGRPAQLGQNPFTNQASGIRLVSGDGRTLHTYSSYRAEEHANGILIRYVRLLSHLQDMLQLVRQHTDHRIGMAAFVVQYDTHIARAVVRADEMK